MSVHEACGVFGVMSPRPIDAADLCYYFEQRLSERKK